MIWIKNHGVRGHSDDLRISLKNNDVPVVASTDAGETTPVVVTQGWTGLQIDRQLPDEAIENGFLDGLGSQVRFAYDESADHPDYADKSEELDAYYKNTHPEQS